MKKLAAVFRLLLFSGYHTDFNSFVSHPISYLLLPEDSIQRVKARRLLLAGHIGCTPAKVDLRTARLLVLSGIRFDTRFESCRPIRRPKKGARPRRRTGDALN